MGFAEEPSLEKEKNCEEWKESKETKGGFGLIDGMPACGTLSHFSERDI